jgi:hypothetical protein
MLSKFYILCFCLVLFTLSSYPIQSCSIPVYQYALEYWSADPYEIFIFQREALSSEDQAKVNYLKNRSQDKKNNANVLVKTIDLSKKNPELRKLWELQGKPRLPHMIIKYPRFSNISDNVWSGNIKDVNAESIINSPTRKEIAKRLLGGEVAVWVFLESGNIQKDKTTLQLLETQLQKMSETLKIEIPIEYIGKTKDINKEARFSVLKLSRDDQRERFLAKILLNSEPDLKAIPEPMAFPIFGKGRCLYSLVGEGINADNIKSACSFLIGWCSCEVKEMNPGVDLLLSANRDKNTSDESQIDSNITKIAISSSGNSNNFDNDKKEPVNIQIRSLDTGKRDRNEINKEIKKITANARQINTTVIENEPSNMARNIVVAVLAIFLGVTAVSGVMFWRKTLK